MKTPCVPVAKEGYPFIALAAFVTVVLALLSYVELTLFGVGLTTFVLYFFRDPDRTLPSSEDSIVSPADGKVIVVQEVNDDVYFKHRVMKISIFMNVFNVHVNRTPFSGTVDNVIYSPGKFYAADSPKAALDNETCALMMTSANGHKFAFVQMAGLIARRIVCWAEKEDELIRGQRFGLIRFGSRVDLYLPLNTNLEVKVGDKVRAGESIIGIFNKEG